MKTPRIRAGKLYLFVITRTKTWLQSLVERAEKSMVSYCPREKNVKVESAYIPGEKNVMVIHVSY